MTHTTPPTAALSSRVRQTAGSLLLNAGVRTKQFIDSALLGKPPVPDVDADPLPQTLPSYPVVAYFAEAPVRGYQLEQWLPVLERVAESHPVLVVVRNWEMAVHLRATTRMPVAFARSLDGLLRIYEQIDAKAVLYVNNGVRNFQSLIYRHALHVHVNHGESDKVSMVSNQAKAYDHVVVAGQAAVDRHRRALIDFDLDRLVVCGRPQLDLDIEQSVTPVEGLRTVLYAPTWEGEDDANNYTSLDGYGVEIVRAVLARPDVRLVYKPHPRVPTSGDRGVARAHAEIVRLVQEANQSRTAPRRHILPFKADILSVFEAADLLVTDISSVGLDFLYLRPDVPIILTDRRTDRRRLLDEAPIARAADVIDAASVSGVAEMLAANFGDDPHGAVRAEVRDHYFGFARGESSKRFLEFLDECIARRETLLEGSSPAEVSTQAGADAAFEKAHVDE